MNKEQQIHEDQQAENPQWSTQRNKNVSIRHRMLSIFSLIHCPPHPQTTRQKHGRMTHMIKIKGKTQPNQCRHLINHLILGKTQI